MDDTERTENLGGGIKALTTERFGFGADAVLLADFSSPRGDKRLCDLGTGCGIIPLLWCRARRSPAIDAFEIQRDACYLARKAAELNGLAISVYNTDLREIEHSFYGRYDLVASNPPYFRVGAAKLSREESSAAARHETECTLEDVVCAASRLLHERGRFCLCQRPDRLADVFVLMRRYGIEPKRLRLVQQNASSRPWLALVEGRKGGGCGLETLPVLLAEENGAQSEEMRRIYGDYT
jgi:tRNA1Val (adenine37-N6)-methyltransferase